METRPTVLIIDDNQDAREVLRALLEENGYRALVASDGPQGLTIARDEKPDCILLDIMMPEMSGFQFCQSLRSDPACEQIAIIILTARKVERDRSYARTVGADDFLIKPVRRSRLLATVHKHIAGRGRRQAARQLGMRHLLAITTDPSFVRLLNSAIDAYNFVRKAGSRFELAEAASLAEARSILDKHLPAAVIVDAKARNEGADQIVRRLKADPKHKGLPLVVVRHGKSDDLKLAWADARLPGRPNGKAILAAVAQLVER